MPPAGRYRSSSAGHPIASATLGTLPDGRPRLRRPDLVLIPRSGDGLPVAIEVELTVKAAVTRAVRAASAADVITILSLKQTLEARGVTLAA